MTGCGTATFTDPDDYRKNVPGTSIDLVLAERGDFRARVTWIDTGRLRLIRCEENVPRVAFIRFAPDNVFVSLPMIHDPPPIWGGIKMEPGEIVLHGKGERSHQRIRGPGFWSYVSMAPKALMEAVETFAQVSWTPMSSARIVRPPSRPLATLSRLHARACRVCETKAELIAHPEVMRAVEQDLTHTLVNCLMSDRADRDTLAIRRYAEVVTKAEDVLASHSCEQLSGFVLAEAVGVTERTLRRACANILGMSPGHYARLRRLNLVGAALRRADPQSASVSEIARQHGFSELGRFSVAYRALFGESPSMTLRRGSSQKVALTDFA
jgi:AraC-like DNA-binding protein